VLGIGVTDGSGGVFVGRVVVDMGTTVFSGEKVRVGSTA
jgi:hypothetical protein